MGARHPIGGRPILARGGPAAPGPYAAQQPEINQLNSRLDAWRRNSNAGYYSGWYKP
jgi:hypothetical protein